MPESRAPHELGVLGLSRAIAAGDVSALEATDHFLDRIERLDGQVHSFVFVNADAAREQARAIDARRGKGEALPPLAGVPIALKDNICVRDEPTTCASKILGGFRPPYDATATTRLRQAGAVLLGKVNMDEFAMGSSTETSAHGITRNPHDLTRTPGGSSGGAAAAMAARFAAGTFGSDTGGSVRQPGAYCGVTAVKPTYGRVSRYGLIAFASSLDQIGPFATNVRDAAALLGVVAGQDARDATCIHRPTEDYVAACDGDVKGLRIGIAHGTLEKGCNADVMAAVEAALQRYRGMGCEVVDVELPHAAHGVAAYYIVAPAEASSNLARFDGMRFGLRVGGEDLRDTYARTRGEGFGPEVKRRIMLGTYVLSAGYYDAYYLRAQRVRTLIRRDYEAAFDKCDVIISPTAPDVAFTLGAKSDDPLAMYMEDIFTLPASLAGLPAISVPCGEAGGLPIGMQLTGPALSESRLLRLAAAFEADHGPAKTPEGF